jgi:hypothetical protein
MSGNLKNKRINELDALLARKSRLTTDEYVDLLHEIRKNYLIKLAVLSIEQKVEGTGAVMNIVDKTHWLLDSVQGPEREKYGPDVDDGTIRIQYGMELPTKTVVA